MEFLGAASAPFVLLFATEIQNGKLWSTHNDIYAWYGAIRKPHPPLTESYTNLGKWASIYYAMWFDEPPQRILWEIQIYNSGQKFPFDRETISQFGDGSLGDYWSFCEEAAPELSRMAQFLFSITVTSASCERLFSRMGSVHTDARNRLNSEKVLKICQIHSDIVKDRAKCEKHGVSRSRICEDNSNQLLETTATANDDFVEEMLQQWQQAIEEWRLDMDDEFVDELLVDDSDDATRTTVHPADDMDGKQPLMDVFGKII
jgi:hypothetical protein